MAQEPDLMKVSEVAATYRVDTSTVRRWITQGQIRGVRLPGGHYRLRREDVERLLSGDAA